jgi:hypothetical protein
VTAHRLVFLSCNGRQDGHLCDNTTMSDLYVAGASPTTVKAAEAQPQARGWHRRPDGRHICPDCWDAGQR